ncbi:MAG: hypothetical protein JW889_16350 [Verrucomicrobia bacterium]|nr:hypothetical protein [Verrucomicrobiota bacterium]
MSSLVEVLNRLSANVPIVLLNVAWQCAAVFLVAFAAVKLFRPRSPLTRHLVWLLALVGIGVCPLIALSGLVSTIQLLPIPLAMDITRAPLPEFVAGDDDPVPATPRADGSKASTGVPPSDIRPSAAGATEPATTSAAEEDNQERLSGDFAVKPTAAPVDSGPSLRLSWPACIGAAWALGVLLLLVRLVVAQWALQRLIKRATVPNDARLLRAFASARALVGAKGDVALGVSDELAVPVAAGLFHRCVLFPAHLATQLPEADLETIAVHELTHIRRRDPFVMLVQRLIEAALFFHPAIWLASRQLCAAREELCDEAVVSATSKPVAYAKCLTSLFEQTRVLAHCRVAGVGMAHYRSKLFRRVETLLSGRMLLLRCLPRTVTAAVIGAACAALALIGGTTIVRTQETCAAQPDLAAPAAPHRWVSASGLAGEEVRALVLCQSRPGVLYAATRNDVYRTIDGAKHWQPCAGHQVNGRRMAADDVAVDPKDPRIVYVTSGRLHKSTDGGASWKPLPVAGEGGSVAFVEADPKTPGTLYVADQDRGVLRSTDGGDTWLARNRGLIPKNKEFLRLEMDPNVPQMLYCLVGEEIFVTTDGGGTWRAVQLPFEVSQLKGVRVGGAANDVLYAGTTQDVYYYSEDGGQTWESLYAAEQDPEQEQTETIKELRRCFLYGLANAGRQSRWTGGPIVADPTKPDVVYRVAMELASVLKTEDFGETWTVVNTGFSSFETRDMACDNETPGLLYVAGRSGLYKSTDGAKTWTQLMTQSWCGPPVTIHPLDPKTILVGTGDDRVVMSTDGGESWSEVSDTRHSKIEAFVFDPEDVDTFYILTRARILKTSDHGDTWEPTEGSIGLSRRSGDWPGTGQENAATIYEITERKHLRRSTDVGRTWQEVMALDKYSENWIRFVEVHPTDPRVAIVAEWNGPLYLTRDAGKTWQTLENLGSLNSMRPSCVAFDPKDPDVFYVGSDSQANILGTRDGGKTFETLSTGLPDSNIVQIAVSAADGAVYAGTDGAGVYRLEVGKTQ